ncbi:hypothetical protein EC957_006644 [Mortierella hygrophila]|uniref:Uncharacterized protein n=1 Tax=Mortierella hygrophila TaxID=979708 RepID=A0A9P6FEI3_9FUNG|nr:hypothetical protein EC957_006644 [Mortierella hygrophila]
MGWFSKSSSTTPVEHPKQEDTTPAVATSTAATTSTTTTAEEPVAEVKMAPEAPIVAAQLPVMEFDEYKQPDDIYARFQVSDAMNELAACSLKTIERYGKGYVSQSLEPEPENET